jgi:hypothetical protein
MSAIGDATNLGGSTTSVSGGTASSLVSNYNTNTKIIATIEPALEHYIAGTKRLKLNSGGVAVTGAATVSGDTAVGGALTVGGQINASGSVALLAEVAAPLMHAYTMSVEDINSQTNYARSDRTHVNSGTNSTTIDYVYPSDNTHNASYKLRIGTSATYSEPISVSAGVATFTGALSAGTQAIAGGVTSVSSLLSSGSMNCGTNPMTCGALYSGVINSGTNSLTAGNASVSSLTSTGAINSGTNSISGGAGTLSSLTVNGTVSSGTNAMTCGSLSSGAISSGTFGHTGGAASFSSLTSTGTVSSGTNPMTCGSLSCSSVNSTGTASVTALTSSGTISSGTNSISCGSVNLSSGKELTVQGSTVKLHVGPFGTINDMAISTNLSASDGLDDTNSTSWVLGMGSGTNTMTVKRAALGGHAAQLVTLQTLDTGGNLSTLGSIASGAVGTISSGTNAMTGGAASFSSLGVSGASALTGLLTANGGVSATTGSFSGVVTHSPSAYVTRSSTQFYTSAIFPVGNTWARLHTGLGTACCLYDHDFYITNNVDYGTGTTTPTIDNTVYSTSAIALNSRQGEASIDLLVGAVNAVPSLVATVTTAGLAVTGTLSVSSTSTFTGLLTVNGGVSLPTSGGTASTLNYYEENTFSCNAGTAISGTTCNMSWVRTGKQVCLKVSAVTATSNSINPIITDTAIPLRIRPSTDIGFVIRVKNSTYVSGFCFLQANGILAVYLDANGTGFTSGVSVGFSDMCLTYNV